VHVLSLDGRAHGPIEWETDRAQFIGRGRTLDRPQALDGRPLSGSTGFVLDPILSLRQRVRLPAGESVRICFATGVANDRDTARALALTYRDPSTAMRTLSLALAHAQGPSPAHEHLQRRCGAVRAAGIPGDRHRRIIAAVRGRAGHQRARAKQLVARMASQAISRSSSFASSTRI
jgi:hypothetical protein